LLAKVQLADLQKLAEKNTENERELLDKVFKDCQQLLNDLANILSSRYFDHQERYHQVHDEDWEDE
jgi:hypothetical protein